MQPFVGYPGGKSRALKSIVSILDLDTLDYCRVVEPFCGGGAFTLGTVYSGDPCWLNDLDQDLIALWKAVVLYTDDFCDLVQGATISSDMFYTLKDKLLTPHKAPKTKRDILYRALDKLIVHKISFSNMGEMSGSPVGGRNQTGKWKFDCRWKPNLICTRLRQAAALLAGVTITSKSYTQVLSKVKSSDLVFIDPPYVDAGSKCYKHSFTMKDHLRLAEMLKTLKCAWALTYDYHPEILRLYASWAQVFNLKFNYFMSSAYRSGLDMKTGQELLISNLI